MMLKNEFVFREIENGDLEFVGDFDGLYRSERDPWEQSGTGKRLRDYYNFSRSQLRSLLLRHDITGCALEIGSGLGYVVNYLDMSVPHLKVDGLEISQISIEHARSKFDSYHFIQGDITDCDLLHPDYDGIPPDEGVYDVVILSQVLWYILHRLGIALGNCHQLLQDGGYLIVSQAFLRERQRYGTDIVDGYDGFVEYMLASQKRNFELVERHYDYSKQFVHHDGLLLFQRLS